MGVMGVMGTFDIQLSDLHQDLAYHFISLGPILTRKIDLHLSLKSFWVGWIHS